MQIYNNNKIADLLNSDVNLPPLWILCVFFYLLHTCGYSIAEITELEPANDVFTRTSQVNSASSSHCSPHAHMLCRKPNTDARCNNRREM